MDKQTQLKILQLTHQFDKLIAKLQNLAEDLTYEEVDNITIEIKKINKTIKKLKNE